jgi:glycosyltransferase involved in cell wall biosynthesis
MRKVLFTNNYPMKPVREAALRSAYPRHHLWGADALEAKGLQVVYVSGAESRLLRAMTERAHGRLGDLNTQLSVVRQLRRACSLYAANETDLRLLAMLRPVLPGRRLIVLFHHRPTRRQQVWIRNIDVALCLSSLVARTLLSLGLRDHAVRLLHWGPDLDYPLYEPIGPVGGGPIVSAGKSGRDVDTLLRALRALESDSWTPPAYVYSQGLPPDYEHLPRNCAVIPLSPSSQLPLDTTLSKLREASIVAIPLRAQDRGLAGLTELLDALAMAKPVIMTRNPLIDFDIEAEGCGIVVEPGDVEGWTAALRMLSSDSERQAHMGRCGRALVENRYNYRRFSDEIVEVFERRADAGASGVSPSRRAGGP